VNDCNKHDHNGTKQAKIDCKLERQTNLTECKSQCQRCKSLKPAYNSRCRSKDRAGHMKLQSQNADSPSVQQAVEGVPIQNADAAVVVVSDWSKFSLTIW
jgi:ABC-type molybdate transport system substrate-binding protein